MNTYERSDFKMQASKSRIMSLIGSSYTQLKIPIYQRTYDWKKKHCERLINDVFAAKEHGKEHFTGSIVYLTETNFSRERVNLIIDGQQRITTVIITLKALEDLAKELNHIDMADQIKSRFLMADTQDFRQTNKLIPTDEDSDNFNKLMLGNYSEMDQESSLFQNYYFIKSMLDKRLTTKDELTNFYTTLINQMTIVELVLDKGIDDPQEIFESINSTGLELSQGDLIRNYLLMSASANEQDVLYVNYWKPLFQMLRDNYLEDFFFVFLLFKVQKTLRFDEIYNNYVNYFETNELSREEALSELLYFGKVYESLIRKTNKYSGKVSELLLTFGEIEQTTIFPFLLNILKDFDDEIMEEDELVNVLKLFLSYHVRRVIVGAPSASLRTFYIGLYGRIFAVKKNKERYYDSIATFMSQLKTKDEIPSDNAVLTNIKALQIYRQSSVVKYLLSTLENEHSKEKLIVDNLTIEHVMPQTLTANWRNMLGEEYNDIYENYLHTIGNLTITGYNTNLGNKPFDEKKEIIEEKSRAKYLNQDILDKARWSEPEILSRTKRLGKELITIFSIPSFDNKGLRFENVEEFDLDYVYDDIKGRKTYSIKFIDMDKEITVPNFRQMLIEVIQILDSIDSNRMDDVARELFNPWEGRNDKLSNSENLNKDTYHTKIRDNLYLVGGFSSGGVIESIRKLMNIYGIEENNFKFYLRT